MGSLGGLPIGVTAAFDPQDAQVIYVATFRLNGENIRLRSADSGATFENITGPRGHQGVFRLRVSPHDSKLLLAGMTGDGIQRSSDSGKTWEQHQSGPSLPTAPGSFAQAPSAPERIYLHGTSTLARSKNGGGEWDRLVAPQTLSYTIAVHPTDPDLVLLAPLLLVADGVLRSTDGGETWAQRPLNGVAPLQITFSSLQPDVVYAAAAKMGQGNFGVYRSDNAGVDWQQLTPASWHNALAPSGVIEHPDGDGKLLVATVNGIYQSNAEQTEFSLHALEGHHLLRLAALPGLWVAGGEEAAFVKDGDTWTQHPFPGSSVYTVLLDPERPDRVLLGVGAWDKDFEADSPTGLFVSEDRGQTFTHITEDLFPADQIYHLQKDLSASDSYLFSVYSGAGGLYRLQL